MTDRENIVAEHRRKNPIITNWKPEPMNATTLISAIANAATPTTLAGLIADLEGAEWVQSPRERTTARYASEIFRRILTANVGAEEAAQMIHAETR